jgi:hypothetical protein
MNISSSTSSTDSSRESYPDCSPGRSDLMKKLRKREKHLNRSLMILNKENLLHIYEEKEI